jgi:hypothetical protein
MMPTIPDDNAPKKAPPLGVPRAERPEPYEAPTPPTYEKPSLRPRDEAREGDLWCD